MTIVSPFIPVVDFSFPEKADYPSACSVPVAFVPACLLRSLVVGRIVWGSLLLGT